MRKGKIPNDCITPGFLDRYNCAWMFPKDAEHFAGEHETPDPYCPKCNPYTEEMGKLLHEARDV